MLFLLINSFHVLKEEQTIVNSFLVNIMIYLLIFSIFYTVLFRRLIVDRFERSGKMQLVFISDLRRNFGNFQICHLEKTGSLCHTILKKELYWRLPGHSFKQLAEISPVDSKRLRDLFDRNILGIVVFDERYSFAHIKISKRVCGPYNRMTCRTNVQIKKQIQMPDNRKSRSPAP